MRKKLAIIAARQGGPFTRAQALESYSPSEVRTLLAKGVWMTMLRGVYSEAEDEPSALLRMAAARLRLGGRVVACRDTSAQLHRIDVLADPATHVLTDRTWPSKVAGLVIHDDKVNDSDLVRWCGVLTTSRVRTAIDLARRYDRLDALAMLDLAVRRGVTHEALVAELARQAGKRGIRQATELVGYANGKAESPMESRARMRCIDAGLPAPAVQFEVPLPSGDRRLDLAWPQWKIGLEYESGLWHNGEDAASRDNLRHNWLVDNDWTMFYVTAHMVYQRPDDFLVPIAAKIPAH